MTASPARDPSSNRELSFQQPGTGSDPPVPLSGRAEETGEPRVFLWTVLTLLAVYASLRFVVPWISLWLGTSQIPVPVPRFAIGLYMLCAVIGALVYVNSDARRWRLFLGPVVRLFALPRERIRWPQAVVFGAIPLVIGALAWNRVMPSSQPPAQLRMQHPTMPQKYVSLENPFRKLPEAERQKAEAEGVILYQKNCRPCHGTSADGNGPLARGLRLRPVNFTDPGTIATVVEPYVFWRVKEGGIGLPAIGTPWESAMPAWSDLTDDEIWKVVMATYALAGKEPRKPEGASP
ncbi:MAG: c-type cytochrome [Gemmatimonadetes bacterium]|nr:c-type cytochrome [Gemmatimonadota bacterium]